MKTPDAIKKSIVDFAPKNLKPYLQLSRFDRPIGFWLLGLPCIMGQCLGRIGIGFSWFDAMLLLLWAIGAVAMRGAGCTINDIADKDFDSCVERTKNRPLACGLLSTKQAYIWLSVQLIIGLLVLFFLPRPAQIIALLSVPMVIAYPFMKRITWWPQAWLGMTFNWGILVGFAAVAPINMGMILLWIGAIFWTLGYDTIYAMSDVQDDALIGVKSTARRFGNEAPKWVEKFYLAASLFFAAAVFFQTKDFIAIMIGAPFFMMVNQRLNAQSNALFNGQDDYTKLFRSNKEVGFLMILTLLVIVIAGEILKTPHIINLLK
jgi:4-hydroxybenzoate polyprenyltransferase